MWAEGREDVPGMDQLADGRREDRCVEGLDEEERGVAGGRKVQGLRAVGHAVSVPVICVKAGRGKKEQGSGWQELASLSCVKTKPLTNDWYSMGLGATLLHQPHPHCVSLLGRGGMIQTCEQYQFVHHVMSLYEKQLSRQPPE